GRWHWSAYLPLQSLLAPGSLAYSGNTARLPKQPHRPLMSLCEQSPLLRFPIASIPRISSLLPNQRQVLHTSKKSPTNSGKCQSRRQEEKSVTHPTTRPECRWSHRGRNQTSPKWFPSLAEPSLWAAPAIPRKCPLIG